MLQKKSERDIIIDKTVVLAAILLLAVFDYGIRCLLLCAAGAGTAAACEAICARICKRKHKAAEAAVNGVILAMLMPPTVPFSLVIVSGIAAIIIGNLHLSQHTLLPAPAAGYTIAFLFFRSAVQNYPVSKGMIPLFSPESVETAAGLSDAWNRHGTFPDKIADWLTGLPSQPIGTGSIVILTAAALVLLFRRSASGAVMIPYLIVSVAVSLIFGLLRRPGLLTIGVLLTNQLMFSAIFLFGDKRCAPPGLAGILYGMLAAFLTAYLSRFRFITDAAVLAAVMISPLSLLLRALLYPPKRKHRKKHNSKPKTEQTAAG